MAGYIFTVVISINYSVVISIVFFLHVMFCKLYIQATVIIEVF